MDGGKKKKKKRRDFSTPKRVPHQRKTKCLDTLTKCVLQKDGVVKPKNEYCPNCGEGCFLANHHNRLYCGQCYYSKFKQQSGKEVAAK